jgi:MFS family permease
MERKWWTLIAVSVAIFMLLLDITVVNVALPDIQRSLHSSFQDLQWVVNAYSLTLAAFLLTAGAVADLIGRRRVFTLGLVVFTASSAVCGLSDSPLMLNLARAVQGTGGAMMFATSLALIAGAFHGKERGLAFGVYGGVIGAAVAVGPVIGGVITSGIGWEWIFFVNVPIGIGAVFLTLSQVSESRDPNANGVDWIGLVTFSGSLFLLVFALIEGNEKGWGSTRIVAYLIAAAILFVAFLLAEHRQERPMLDLSLFRRPAFAGASIVALAVSASMFSMFLYLTLYIQALPADHAADVRRRADLGQTQRAHPRTYPARRRAAARERGPARDDGRGRKLGLDDTDPRLPDRRHRRGLDQPAARVDRRRRRAPHAQRHGLGRQQHLPPGGHRDRHRWSRRRLPARRHRQDDRRTVLERPWAPGAGRSSRPPRRRARLRRRLAGRTPPLPRRPGSPRPLLPRRLHQRVHHHPDDRRRDRPRRRAAGVCAGARKRLRGLRADTGACQRQRARWRARGLTHVPPILGAARYRRSQPSSGAIVVRSS